MFKKMNFLAQIAFLACVLVVYAKPLSDDEKQAMYKELVETCKAQEGASDADVQEMATQQLPSTRQGQCLNACAMENIGMMKDAKLSVEGCLKIAEMYGEPQRVKNVEIVSKECESIVAADRCDAALQIIQCVAKAAASHGFDRVKDLL